MSDERQHADHEALGRDDAELVRRISESYRPPAPAASMRATFRERLDARIRRRAVVRRWGAGAATAAVAIAVVWLRGPLATDVPASDATSDEALLALALPADLEVEVLPADYQAIEDLLLEDEGV